MSVATLDNIKTLRARLDAPYKDCIKALDENDNNLEQAETWLKNNSKIQQRTAKAENGVIGYYKGDNSVSLVVVKCETDFVAINPNFIKYADELAKDLNANAASAVDNFKEKIWTFKEAIEIGAHLTVPYNDEQVALYMHHNRSRATILRYTGGEEADALKIAMHICAINPSVVSRKELCEQQLSDMHQKAKEEALTSGKPENIADKIAEGKVNNSLKEFVLLEQPMFDDAKTTVGSYAGKKGINILKFVNITL